MSSRPTLPEILSDADRFEPKSEEDEALLRLMDEALHASPRMPSGRAHKPKAPRDAEFLEALATEATPYGGVANATSGGTTDGDAPIKSRD